MVRLGCWISRSLKFLPYVLFHTIMFCGDIGHGNNDEYK